MAGRAGAINLRARVAIARLRAIAPDADRLLADVEAPQLIVGHASFGLRADRERAHLAAIDAAVSVVE